MTLDEVLALFELPFSALCIEPGRTRVSDAMQALCLLAGANSVFYGEKLLTTGNPDTAADRELFEPLGVEALNAAY